MKDVLIAGPIESLLPNIDELGKSMPGNMLSFFPSTIDIR